VIEHFTNSSIARHLISHRSVVCINEIASLFITINYVWKLRTKRKVCVEMKVNKRGHIVSGRACFNFKTSWQSKYIIGVKDIYGGGRMGILASNETMFLNIG